MKPNIILLAGCLSLAACTDNSDKVKSENLALAARFLHAVETKDVKSMGEMLADNYRGFGPSDGDSVNKEQALLNFKNNSENLYESVRYEGFQNIAITVKEGEQATPGDWVSNWAYVTIKYKDGRGPVHVWTNAVYRIEKGKIVFSRTFYNEADVLRQLGYVFTPPGE